MKRLLTAIIAFSLFTIGFAAPARVPSYGPNGTHWPDLIPTPYPGDHASIPNVIDVNCSWSAISTALSGLTAAQVNAGVLIRVRPGVLDGNGSGAGDKAVLQNYGSLSWTKRVTICPKDGYGTVSMTYVRFQRLYNIAFVGFDIGGSNFTACANSALVWSFVSGGFCSFYSDDNFTTSNFELTEVVFGTEALTATSDRSFFYVGGAGGYLKDFKIDGCYFAPKYRKAGISPSPHVDTIQWGLGAGGAQYPRGFLLRDTVVYSSQTTAFQRVDYATFERVFAIGGTVARQRYPYTPGCDNTGGNYIFNGAGFYNVAKDCVFIGQHKFTNSDAPQWQKVTNTRVSTNFLGTAPVEGSWTIDSSLNSLSLGGLPEIPTTSVRGKIWNWGVMAAPTAASISVDIK